MEYCQLSDLAQFMKKRHDLHKFPETADIFKRYPNPPAGGLNEVLSRHFLKQIASALKYLREGNLIHRDIKPQNLLLNPAPSFMARQKAEDKPLAASEHSLTPAVGIETLPMLKIADFGFARHLPSTSMAETLCGSPLYMAPEILRYEKYDARADLWSTGTVLYEMVVGKPPFRAQNHVELLRRIEKANDVIVFDNKTMTISRGMKDLIRKLLKKSPLDRITYDQLFADGVITGDIPGLVPEDQPRPKPIPAPETQVSELARRMATQTIDQPASPRRSSEVQPRRSQEEGRASVSRKSSDYEGVSQRDGVVRRTSSSGNQTSSGTQPRDIQRQPSLQQRRPSIVAHATAPGRQELQYATTAPTGGARMERRPSRASPLAGPPLVREPSMTEAETTVSNRRTSREIREQAAQEMVEEKEYVVIEKRSVEVNAFADEMEANSNQQNRNQNQGTTMVRRATTQGPPTSITGAQPPSPSRGMLAITGRQQAMHQRAGSFERRYAPSPQSATNMLTKALTAANNRLFNVLGTSPPFGGKGISPPGGYTAFPAYPAVPGTLLLGDGSDSKAPMDEDSKIMRIMEEAAHRSDCIFGFAEVKYKQLAPPTPSTPSDGLGIQDVGNTNAEGEEEKPLGPAEIVEIAEEGLVLYVKTLAILAKTIDLAGTWWNKHNRGEVVTSDSASRNPSSNTAEVGKRMNNVVQWSRGRFNECLEKSEFVSRKLLQAQKDLPEDHPAHPSKNSTSTSSTAGGSTVGTSAEQIRIFSGITAEKLMFERAVEMSKAAAVHELVGEDLLDCELGYSTAIKLLEAILDPDDEPLMRKLNPKKVKPADEIINGMETEDRQMVMKRKS